MISLVALGAVLRGLYFFSAGGFSPAREEVLQKKPKQNHPKHRKRPQNETSDPIPGLSQLGFWGGVGGGCAHLCRLMGIGFRLYLSAGEDEELFLAGVKDGVSISRPMGGRREG